MRVVTSMVAGAAHHRTPVATVRPSEEESTYLKRPIRALYLPYLPITGEGDCDGPQDGGANDGHQGCQGDLVCGSNNCMKFGTYYHEKVVRDTSSNSSETRTNFVIF